MSASSDTTAGESTGHASGEAGGPAPAGSPPRLVTPNVYVDTSVFKSNHLVYDEEPFKSFMAYARRGELRVFETRLLVGEIHARINEAVDDAVAALGAFRKAATSISGATLPEIRVMFQKKGRREQLRDHFVDHLERFRSAVSIQEIPLDPISVDQMVDDYLNRRPPFGTGDKKVEFPDAITVRALDRWCREHDAQMYVVSEDSGMREAAAGLGTLIPVERLGHLVGLTAATRAATAVQQVRSWVGAHRQTLIAPQVEDAVNRLYFILEDAEGEVEDVEIEMLSFDEPEVLSVDEESAEIQMPVAITVTAVIDYKDPDDGIWDSEDKVWLWQPSSRRRVRHVIDGDLGVSLSRESSESEWSVGYVSVDRDTDVRISIEDETVELLGGEGWESLRDEYE